MHILVVDDDLATTELLTIILQPICACALVANSGHEGVIMAREFSPDIILLDLMMPDMSGLETFLEIRKFSSAPVLILSAADNPRQVAEALNAGADEYLIKPVTSRILTASINKLLRRREFCLQIEAAAI